MATKFDRIDDKHRDFIARQHIFFTASAAPDTRVNVSPRSTDAFRVLGPKQRRLPRPHGKRQRDLRPHPRRRADDHHVLRLRGAADDPQAARQGTRARPPTPEFDRLLADAFAGEEPAGARQIVVLDADLVVTSCGYGVPMFAYQRERPSLDNWAKSKSEAELARYRHEKNRVSLDGVPTGLADEEAAAAAE